jgi:hypothetical protein
MSRTVVLAGVIALIIPLGALAVTFTETTAVTGQLRVDGTVSKGSGTFVIDHPLDPKNKLLYHSFVESPEATNIYDGIVVLDETGSARITLPGYFIALNTEYRYLATPIGQPMPNLYLSEEVSHTYGFIGSSMIKISGGAPNGKISWQVTGVRKDPFIIQNPIVPEVAKGPHALVNVGEYVSPELYEK